MSELERERHKNLGLERARDSWYQQYFKANQRAEQAEATLAKATKVLRYGEEKDLPMLYSESQAALAERDKALEDLYCFLKHGDLVTVRTPGERGSVTFKMDRLADLRARAEEGTTP